MRTSSLPHLTAVGSRIGLMALLVATPSLLGAQEQSHIPFHFREAVSLETDNAVDKKLATLKDHLAEQQWGQAIDILDDIAATHGESLIAVSPGRYVNVARYCTMMRANLPEAARRLYRQQVDPQARRWFERGRDQHERGLLQKVVQEAFLSRYGDEALFLLGEWAWQRGDLSLAESYWTRMLPLAGKTPPGEPLPALRYPDTDHDPAAIRARLILCSLAQGKHREAQGRWNAFDRLHPEAGGQLAGRQGNLADLLKGILSESQAWRPRGPETVPQTFAFNRRRNGTLPEPVSVGAIEWTAPLASDPFFSSEHQPALSSAGPLSYHPVVFDDMLLVKTAERIHAFQLANGRPPWSGQDNSETQIYPEGPEMTPARPSQPSIGVPDYTMTVAEGRLYARMGPPIIGRAREEFLGNLASSLICLDLAHGQGKLVWKVSDETLGPNWSFAGSPIVSGSRLYVPLRQGQPQTQANVACYEAETGRLIWNRKVCASISTAGKEQNRIGHQLLTVANRTVFFSTDLGAIAALEAADGRLRWVVTYKSRRNQNDRPEDPDQYGLLPCVFHQGTIFAAPNDSNRVMAIDAESGIVKWKRTLNDSIRHLLGTSNGHLIASGDSLWGLDLKTGRIHWGRPCRDPEFAGYGRGLLVADHIWWPTRERIHVLAARTGRPVRQPINLRAKAAGGGNLLIAKERLVVAQPDRLVVFSPYAGSSKPNEAWFSSAAP